ncbi:MAG: CCA tRNA nucleotidyltransferase [Johnsonella sp.]|nr:CCA tRNA nucleotidyltransferase [Johnsonella sp.]
MRHRIKIELPEDVGCIIRKLEEAGFEGYAVGGCIRDSILGKAPEDWDIATNAKPPDIKRCFARTVDTGIAHGTVTVLLKKKSYEVTTYRVDGVYSDGRHPDRVEFSSLLEEDLRRRDFTINAMAYSGKEGLIDLFGGMEDLERKLIRCVGSAEERFGEDALRMLRAARFCAQLDFRIEEDTYSSMKQLAEGLLKVSKERVLVEMNKALLSKQPQRLKILEESGLARFISSSFSLLGEEDYLNLEGIAKLPPHKGLRWAALLCKREGGFAGVLLKELKADNETTQKVSLLIKEGKESLPQSREGIKTLLRKIGAENLRDLLLLKENAYCRGGESGEDLERIRLLTEEIIEKKEAYQVRMLSIGGEELKSLGLRQGPLLGKILEEILKEVIIHPEYNQRDVLMELAKKYIHREKEQNNERL